MTTPEEDREWFTLLCELQNELSRGLDSLGGRASCGIHDNFRFYSASYINRAVEGYIILRSGGYEASRLLVRAAIEPLFRLLAVRKDASLLYRIAIKDRNEHRKWVFPSAIRTGIGDYKEEDEAAWAKFVETYKAQLPDHLLVDEELSIYGAAKAVSLENYYDTHYRLYCKFTHGALAAMMGRFDEFKTEDNRTMALCVIGALEEIAAMHANLPKFESLQQRLHKLLSHTA